MFYGRKRELDLVLAGANRHFAIFGARRIGKTSLAMQLRSRLQQSDRRSVIFVSCCLSHTARDLAGQILRAAEPEMALRSHTDLPRALLRTLARVGNSVLILDEFDGLLAGASGTQDDVASLLREIANSTETQMLLSGYRLVYRTLQSRDSFLYNLFDTIHLGPLEDTEVDIQAIENEFGEFIADCVSLLTNEPGKNRKERKEKTYAKLKLVAGKEELALVVSAADRLANVQVCIAHENKENMKLLKMYKAEHDAFRDAVYRPGLCEDLWSKINTAISS